MSFQASNASKWLAYLASNEGECMEEAFSVFLLAFSVGLILNYFESRMHPNESRPGIEYDFGLPMHPNGPESDYFTLGQLSL